VEGKEGFIEDLKRRCDNAEGELKKARDELEAESWGLVKTNEAIKVLYRELDKKNKQLQTLDQLKTNFINTASHELRTPLTVIRESISQILDGIHGRISSRQREFLSICLEDVDRLKRIVDDLLDISKIEAGEFKLKKENTDIIELVKRVIVYFSPKAKGLNLELRVNFCSEALLVCIDRDSMIRVFYNLIGNALKFTAKGYIEISVTQSPEWVECSVIDTGKGIFEDDLLMVFGKFQQFSNAGVSAEKGTGLGLNISKSIVELHGGRIWVESTLKVGSKFTFTLPANSKIAEVKDAEENTSS